MKKKAHSIVALSISVRDANDHKPFNNFTGNRGGVQHSYKLYDVLERSLRLFVTNKR